MANSASSFISTMSCNFLSLLVTYRRVEFAHFILFKPWNINMDLPTNQEHFTTDSSQLRDMPLLVHGYQVFNQFTFCILEGIHALS